MKDELMTKIEARPEPAWRERGRGLERALPLELRGWLLSTDSLTQRVAAACQGDFGVRLIGQRPGAAWPSERLRLALPRGARTYVRQVHLCCNNVPRVYARTVIPAGTLSGRYRQLQFLGGSSLGEVLFCDRGVRRGRRDIAMLTPGQALYEAAAQGLTLRPDALWARRSLFFLAGRPLLVNEVFLFWSARDTRQNTPEGAAEPTMQKSYATV